MLIIGHCDIFALFFSSVTFSLFLSFLMGMHHRPVIVSLFSSNMFSPLEIMSNVCLSKNDYNTSSYSRTIDKIGMCGNPVKMCDILDFCGICMKYSLHYFSI